MWHSQHHTASSDGTPMKVICFILVLLIAAFIPLAAQTSAAGEDYEDNYLSDDFFFDDYLFMEGEGLTIVGTPNTTQQMEVIGRETIENTHAPDIPSLLEETIGLGVTRYGPYGNQASVNIRGFDIKRIAILIDGVPINSAQSGGFDFYSIDPLSIEKIEVIYGGSDTKYNVSGALGGIINIITIKKAKPGWSLGASLSNTSYLPGRYRIPNAGIGEPRWQDLADAQNINLFGAYGAENYSFNISVFGNWAGNHFLYNDYFGITRRKTGNEILDAGISVSFIRNIGELTKLIAAGSFYIANKNIPANGYATAFVEQNDMASRENIMLDMPIAFHDDLAMELSVSHHWKRLHYGASTPSIHNENYLSAINRWAWYAGNKFTLRFGGDYRFIYLDSTNTGLHYANRGGLYITPEYSPVRNLLLIASIKGMTDGREIIPVPKFGLSWMVNDILIIKNNYFRSFKFPDFDDLYWEESGFSGNPDLKSEDGWGADLSMELILPIGLNINSTLYGQWTDDSIHWSNESGTWRPENYGSAVLFGWDNKVDFTVAASIGPFGKPVLSLSYLFQISWLLSGNLTFNDDKRIPYMPMHTLGISLELPWKTIKSELPGSLAISGRYESVRYTNTANSAELKPYFLMNIVYNQRVSKNIGVFGKINNVLNTRYFSYDAYPMPGISLILGINMVFEKPK
jgi:vitamin B12 transporter